MMPDLAVTAIEAVRAVHQHGHTCTDGKWYNPHAGTRSRCQTLAHLDTALAQVGLLSAQVHTAAHTDRHVHAVAAAICAMPLADLPPDAVDTWVGIARQAVEALAYSLETSEDLTARANQLADRLTT